MDSAEASGSGRTNGRARKDINGRGNDNKVTSNDSNGSDNSTGDGISSSIKNGTSTDPSNNGTVTNGQNYAKTFDGFSRKEVTRLLIQSLYDLGYDDIGRDLGQASGYYTESPHAVLLRQAVLDGRWDQAQDLLGSVQFQDDTEPDYVAFLVRRQQYLELLHNDQRDEALAILRSKLGVLTRAPKSSLKELSGLLMVPALEIGLDRTHYSREALLNQLQALMSPAVMIPGHRLATLLRQSREWQTYLHDYYMGTEPFTLYRDLPNDRRNFPSKTAAVLSHHNDEVWFLDFSHDGSKLATSSKDRTAIIWSASSSSSGWVIDHVLVGHTAGVVYLSWSPDDSMLVTCSNDHTAILWDTATGSKTMLITEHSEMVAACEWMPDGQHFITGSPDMKMVLWDLDGVAQYTWEGTRILDFALSPDGSKLVAVCNERIVHFYDMATRQKIREVNLFRTLMTVSISSDSKYALISARPGELYMYDLETLRLIRKFVGQIDRDLIIRACFGGYQNKFVLSGSEDNHIYVWNRVTSNLIEVLEGHTREVNCVRWNPRDLAMFASGSDDGTIRIWRPEL